MAEDLRFGVENYAGNHQTDENRVRKTRMERRGPLGNLGAMRLEAQNCIMALGIAEDTGTWG